MREEVVLILSMGYVGDTKLEDRHTHKKTTSWEIEMGVNLSILSMFIIVLGSMAVIVFIVPRPAVLPWSENTLEKQIRAYPRPGPAICFLTCSPDDSDNAEVWEPPL